MYSEKCSEMWCRVPLIVILGATGTGKSKLGIELARKFAGEVIGADSMQISDIDSRSKLPIVVGGTNYYIESLLWKVLVQHECKIIKTVPPEASNSVAADVSARCEFTHLSNEELMTRLEAVDAETALRLHPNDRRKVLRALEVFEQEKRPLSEILREQQSEDGSSPIGGPLRFPRSIIFWLQWDQGVLDEDLDKRVDEMIEKGLLQELLDFHSKYNAERLSSEAEADYTKGIFQSIGFKEFHPYLIMDEAQRETEESKKLLEKCIAEMKMATRRYARRQVKWVNARFLSNINRATPKLVPLTLKNAANWDTEILEPAVAMVQKLLDGETTVATPSEQLSEEQIVRQRKKSEPCREFCEICQRLFVLRDQWEDHLKSNKHKRRREGLKKHEANCKKQKLAEAESA
ncbi:tRNA dimethylallyltransferase isoform X2 [Cloeon dipterum]|uniref:tRNA dimethylallyltransferase isoform X2 n=1 Tax=Cloeon dipterum TaxID=197152 RepID=UPI00322018B3